MQLVNTGLLEITLRLHRRAVVLAVKSALEQARCRLLHGTLPEQDDLHLKLHRILTTVWGQRMAAQGIFRTVLVWSTALVIFIIFLPYLVSLSRAFTGR